MEIKEFAGQFQKLCYAFDKEYKEGQMIVYLEYLRKYKLEALRYAVNEAILSSKYFPKIAEIIDLMREYKEIVPPERQLAGLSEDPCGDPEKYIEEAKIAIGNVGSLIKGVD